MANLARASSSKVNDENDDDTEETQIQWSNLIFLPFNPVFKIFVLISVLIKTMLGPIEAVYSSVYCSDIMDWNIYLFIIKLLYRYFSDTIYIVDTFLHIIHRQVVEIAMTREHLPKNACLLIIDIISLIPFHNLMTYEDCHAVELWPNILGFIEFLVIYRVVEYFSMVSTHHYWKLLIGSLVLLILTINCISCFLILVTEHGLCANCTNGIYDWRKHIAYQFNVTEERLITHIYGAFYLLSLYFRQNFTTMKPSTLLEYFLTCVYLVSVKILIMYIILPKLFSESTLRQRNIFIYYLRVKKLITETKRRNSSKTAHVHVTEFYNLMWKNRSGIINIPNVIGEFPRALRVDLRQDLVWPLFYHSPTLRKTSTPFQRWLCEFINLNYKLPGENFFSGPHCFSNMYYLKSGIVQLISSDDGVTPLLSLTGGTIFGDVSFIVPPERKITVRCLTYCEVITLSRFHIVKAMQKYPGDRRDIIELAKGKIKHARTLYTCKQLVRGLDRTEDEGIVWLKKRWWEISDALAFWRKTMEDDRKKCELPPEEAVYHCSKYIGQIVICSEFQLFKKPTFANVKFPWVLSSESAFIRVWHYIVVMTVFIVLITFPPIVIKKELPTWFKFIYIWTDFIYMADICISLLTSTKKDNIIPEFTTVLFTRCKRPKIVLDILATIWIETFAVLLGYPEMYNLCLTNRLIKIYILFSSEYVNEWNIKSDPMFNVLYHIALIHMCWHYLHWNVYYIREALKNSLASFLLLATAGLLKNVYLSKQVANFIVEATQWLVTFIIYYLVYAPLISCLYLRGRDKTNFQRLVTNLKQFYVSHKIHRDLMKRLDKYLICQWKYYKGMDITHPVSLKGEPFDIYWKVQGEVAERIISESKAFIGADPNFLRELASRVKFSIMPKKATLLLFGGQSRNVTWIVQGHVKCEYHNEEGELLTTILDPGEMVSVETVLLRRPAMKSYSCYTECEIINISKDDFFNIIKRYPNEWSYLQNCIKKINPLFEDIIQTYTEKHKEYLKTLRKRIFHAHATSAGDAANDDMFVDLDPTWRWPNSNFMFYWMIFRVLSVCVSILSAALQGGSGVLIRQPLIIIGAGCDCIACIDVLLKLFVTYYNEKGIVVFDKRKCIINYLTRGFLLDIIGIIPWPKILGLIVIKEITQSNAMVINTLAKFSHLYIVTNLFNYIANSPTFYNTYILILKWQVVTLLVMVGASPYLMTYCVDFSFDSLGTLTHMTYRNECWLTKYKFDDELTNEQLHSAFAESLSFMQNILLYLNFNIVKNFKISNISLGMNIAVQITRIVFMYITCYILIMLILSRRNSTIIQHGVRQLKKFLKAEGVDSALIKNVESHFTYWWKRTKGNNIDNIMVERISVTLRENLFYYFFKQTFQTLDTLLKGGKAVQSQLSYMGYQICFQPNQQIVREMDLLPDLLVVNRGQVVISKNGEELAVLGKGAIFGPLNSNRPRPIRISAKSVGFADILHIPISDFNDIIDDKVRANIANNPESENDYMAIHTEVQEHPYRTLEYILRGRKTIQLPRMKQPVEAHRNWYSAFLYVAWFINPSLSTVLVLLFGYVPDDIKYDITWSMYFIDVIHFAYVISEFWTVELHVRNKIIIKEKRSYKLLLYWGFYVDLISIVVPLMWHLRGTWTYQLARLLRIRLFYLFHVHFCSGFKSRVTPILMKFVIIFLTFHAMICGWIYVACRDSKFPSFVITAQPSKSDDIIDYGEWVSLYTRKQGCCIIEHNKDNLTKHTFYLVPSIWENDYVVAMTFTVLKFTHSGLLLIAPMNVSQIYYKLFVKYLMYLMEQWIISIAISAIYTKVRELYHYDYHVKNLTTYLQQSGLAPPLLDSVKEYTKQLWERQKGNWLPELVHKTPMCLREDLFSALYLHHLDISPVFQNLPGYFKRQLVTRFKRIVMFPGQCIAEQGDIFSCIFFIHEGEVEKWHTDRNSDKTAVGLLTTNDCFGSVPSFLNTPYAFGYYARTVVDLVYLELTNFKDLLEVYTDVKEDLLVNVANVKKEQAKGIYRHTSF